jgi:hypothetical protein
MREETAQGLCQYLDDLAKTIGTKNPISIQEFDKELTNRIFNYHPDLYTEILIWFYQIKRGNDTGLEKAFIGKKESLLKNN